MRTALPGYSFILLVIALNYTPIITILYELGLDSVFGALLGFIALVSGSAIGFLLSQVWWRYYCNEGAHYFYPNGPRREVIRLIEKYGLQQARDKKDQERIQNVVTVYGYVLFSQKKNDPELVNYLIRRGDTFHAFSATRVVLLLGIILGLIFRFFSQFFVFQWNFEAFLDSLGNIPQKVTQVFSYEGLFKSIPDSAIGELLILIFLILAVIILYLVFGRARNWVLEQYANMSTVLINKSEISRRDLQIIFPQNYFNQNNSE